MDTLELKSVSERPPPETYFPPESNRLLCELPEEVKQRIFPHLELVPLELGQVVCEAGSKQRYVYFPLDSIISLLYVMENGASAEIAVVGNDGMVGDLKTNLTVMVPCSICYCVTVRCY